MHTLLLLYENKIFRKQKQQGSKQKNTLEHIILSLSGFNRDSILESSGFCLSGKRSPDYVRVASLVSKRITTIYKNISKALSKFRTTSKSRIWIKSRELAHQLAHIKLLGIQIHPDIKRTNHKQSTFSSSVLLIKQHIQTLFSHIRFKVCFCYIDQILRNTSMFYMNLSLGIESKRIQFSFHRMYPGVIMPELISRSSFCESISISIHR